MSSTLEITTPLPDTPYRGIEPFRFIDQLLFAARDDESWELLSKVTLYRAMLLYGESGTGKSSLINAGLLPAALNDNYIANRLRVQPFPHREIRVERIIQQDGPTPIYLPSTFHPIAAPDKIPGPESASFELSWEAFVHQVSEASLRPDLRGTEAEDSSGELIYEPTTPRPLLIFDQFEEFITLFEAGQRSQQSQGSAEELRDLQRKILDALVTLVRETNLRLKIVFVFREDFLAKLNLLFDYCPELMDQALRLIPPPVSALAEIIRQPFTSAELREHFKETEEGGSELSDQLAQEIASDLSELSENDLINLSELQIICLLLWRSPDPETRYHEKRAKGLLEEYAAGVLGTFPPELQEKAVALLGEMVTASNTRNIVSLADLKTAGKNEGMSEHQVDIVLNNLCQNQIVRRERHRELFFYELASEYLVSWIKERSRQREVDRVTKVALEERRRKLTWRKIAWVQLAVLVLFFIAVLVSGYFARRSRIAEHESEVARQLAHASEQQSLLAEGRARLAEEQRARLQSIIKPLMGSDDNAKLEAIRQIRNWRKEGNLPPEFLLLLVAAQRQSENTTIKDAAKEAITEAAQADPNFLVTMDSAIQSDPNLATKLPLRFNIYLADDSQIGTADKISNALRRKNYVVSGSPSVVPNPPIWDSELRYFTQAENGQPQPTELINLLKSITRTNWRVGYVPRYSRTPGGSAGQFELWLAVAAGHLNLGFVDDAGKPITGVRPRVVQFVLTSGPGNSFKSRNLSITVPQGEYEVTILVPGYKPVQQPLSISGGQTIEWKTVKLTRE